MGVPTPQYSAAITGRFMMYQGNQQVYVDAGTALSAAGISSKNYIINGAMMVSQQNGTTAGTTGGYYPVDQWFTEISLVGGAVSIAQVAKATPAGSPNRIRCTVTTAQAAIGASYVILRQNIEGYRVADLLFGTASAKSVTLKVGVCAPAGTYSVAVINSADTSSASGSFTISAGEANTDVVKAVTLAGPTTGTWLVDSGIGLFLRITLASSTQFNLLGTLGNVFELFDAGLYGGTSAPNFVVPDYAQELALCGRYWEKIQTTAVVVSPTYVMQRTFSARKRATPTISILGTSNGAVFTAYDTVGCYQSTPPTGDIGVTLAVNARL